MLIMHNEIHSFSNQWAASHFTFDFDSSHLGNQEVGFIFLSLFL